ncbi:AT-hook motif nuclear-localized protein 10-like [Zingiber officinale]|uniref:AT-hook motif nuclear-localized protein 10-like n=1 Tax=Zingiber officinale TaxID=94328 RepID=UPI001C4D05FF|nr:AT-hook motif nuclear-localized protein 10-like [Zingiber officinale]XP_042453913.1 AT-hook motif nuclear-localized protein 10-like [Zingiber officinale]
MERDPMLGHPAMHSMPLAAHTDDGQPVSTTLAGSSAAHPQPSPYHQGDGGGRLPGVLDGGFTAQASNSQNIIPGEPSKRKRGRPKKNGPDGNLLSLSQPSSSMSFSGVSNAAPSGSADAPKKRSRPLGSGKKQQTNAQESSRMKLHAHFIIVPAGKDVVSEIVSFFQQGSHSLCILSASGLVSEVKLFQPSTTGGGIVVYKNLFEILSLSGTFQLPLPDNTEQQRQVNGLTISLADKNGRVFGGGLAGHLLAASRVQVVVGRFIPIETDE